MAETQSFGVKPISAHSWNGNRSCIALSLNSNDVEVYKVINRNYQKVTTLTEHLQKVTGIDWAPKSNRIVTCSADRNAYVWKPQDGGSWKNTMVIIRINRAATCVKWSPKEDKFAVGSGARSISVCYFERDDDWWVSKQIKKPIRSTVTCLDWHPNNVLLAAGSSDFKARVFSAYVKEVDEKPSATSWGSKMTFANMMAEFTNGGGGWVHDICFSGNGNCLAWVGHDCSVSVVDASSGSAMVTIKTQFLPFVTCMWVSPNKIVAAGHGCQPVLYDYNGKSITFVKAFDSQESKAKDTQLSARKKFINMDAKAQEQVYTKLKTAHQNTITKISIHTGTKDQCTKFTTVGIDGLLVNWDVNA